MNAIIEHQPLTNGFALLTNPTGIKEAREFAEMFAKTDLVPKAYANKPGDIMIAGAMGARLGLDIFSALAGIAVVNGKPTLYGDAMLAVCQARPDFVDITEVIDGTGDQMTATCTVERKGRKPFVCTFSVEDAKKAGLWGKQGPWSQQPKRMLTMRARAFALRGAFADALAGFHAREEMEDELKEVEHQVVPEPKQAKARTVQLDPTPSIKKKAEATGDAEPVVITDADEKPTAPAVRTVADLVAEAQRIAKEFGTRGLTAVKAFNDKLGVRRTGECPPEHVERAFALLAVFNRELNENAVTP